MACFPESSYRVEFKKKECGAGEKELGGRYACRRG